MLYPGPSNLLKYALSRMMFLNYPPICYQVYPALSKYFLKGNVSERKLFNEVPLILYYTNTDELHYIHFILNSPL